jgi:hypothetical protein
VWSLTSVLPYIFMVWFLKPVTTFLIYLVNVHEFHIFYMTGMF